MAGGSRADGVAVVALGCRVGRSDAASMAAGLGQGFRVAADGEPADWVVVSTCAVTADAAASSRQAVRRAARDNPGARIVVAGCHAAMEPSLLAGLPGVAAVVPPEDHAALPAVLALLRSGRPAPEALSAARRTEPGWGEPPSAAHGPARPVLKVQDGCDCACAFCVVPLARGRGRSLPLEAAVERIARLGRERDEVVLSGVHLGAWGADLSPRRSLADLLRAAARARAVHRIRLSSVEPLELPIDLLREDGGALLCEHFHLPLQSGSDRILRAMGRPHDAAGWARAVEGALRARPEAAVGADVLVGFPGEREEDHRATLDLVTSLPLAYLHVFPFSPRPGTAAASMDDRPPAPEVERRAAELREASARMRARFLAAAAGRPLEVVVERLEGGRAQGTSREFASVRFASADAIRGRVVRLEAGAGEIRGGSGVAPGASPS